MVQRAAQEPLRSHTQRTSLLCETGNKLEALSGLDALAALQRLEVNENQLKSLAGVAALAKLAYLSAVRACCCSCRVPLCLLTRSCGCLLLLLLQSTNQIESLEGVAGAELETLVLDTNEVATLDSLAADSVPKLATLSLANNKVWEHRGVERDCTRMVTHTLYAAPRLSPWMR